MKKLWIIILFGILLLSWPKTAEAETNPLGENLKQFRQEIKKDQLELKKEIRADIQALQKTIIEKLRVRFPKLLPAGLNQAEIVSFSGTVLPATLQVRHDNKEVTLTITEKTVLLRKYGGQSNLSELHVGDIVSARGLWVSDEKVVLDTRVLRNLSVQKRRGTFWGVVKSLAADSFVLTTNARGDQKVFVGSSTKLVDRANKAIEFSDLKTGHRIRVTGLWDSQLSRIEEVRLIKDWSAGKLP